MGAGVVSLHLGRLAARARCLAVALSLAAGAAHAAGVESDLGAPPTAAEQCLTPPAPERKIPAYPPDMLKIKRGDMVSVQLTFDAPTSAPSVRFDTDTQADFREAVLDYARQLRVPCMAAGAPPVTLSQQFDFVPNDGRKVAWTPPVDVSNVRAASDRPCLVNANDRMAKPVFPYDLAQRGKEGNVVLRMRFVDTTQPPVVTVLDNGGEKHFADSVLESVQGLRMVCPAKVEPIEIQVVYRFTLDGLGKHVVLRDLTLPQFLASVKPFPRGNVYFDTTLMKCPFDVRLTFRQPWNRNHVEELDEDVAARHGLLSWLSTLELDLKPRQANMVLGQSMLIQVPCARVDL